MNKIFSNNERLTCSLTFGRSKQTFQWLCGAAKYLLKNTMFDELKKYFFHPDNLIVPTPMSRKIVDQNDFSSVKILKVPKLHVLPQFPSK